MNESAENKPLVIQGSLQEVARAWRGEDELRLQNEELREQFAQLRAINQTLTDSEQRLRLAIATGQIGLWVWNSTDVTKAGDWSPRLKEIFGLPLETEVTHEIFLNCVFPDDRERVNAGVMQALCGAQGGEYLCEYRIIHPGDGSPRWVTARGQAFFDSQGAPVRFIGTLMDITERKRGEESITSLAAELEQRVAERTEDLARAYSALQGEIEGRTRLARDIHDTLAQGFTGVIVQLEAAGDAESRGLVVERKTHIERASNLARESLQEARRSVRALRAQILEENELPPALETLIEKMTAGTSLEAELTVHGDPRRLVCDVAQNLLRIVQEALTNALRHASASRFITRLAYEPETVNLELIDNGAGFDPAASHEGFGLVGIKERVEAMGGRILIESILGKGTTISIAIPASQPQRSETAP
jgi:PAS domain S-box-containing protein